MYYENKLIENKYVWQSKELESKYEKKQLPELWMTEIKSQKEMWLSDPLQSRTFARASKRNVVNKGKVMFADDSSMESIEVMQTAEGRKRSQQFITEASIKAAKFKKGRTRTIDQSEFQYN